MPPFPHAAFSSTSAFTISSIAFLSLLSSRRRRVPLLCRIVILPLVHQLLIATHRRHCDCRSRANLIFHKATPVSSDSTEMSLLATARRCLSPHSASVSSGFEPGRASNVFDTLSPVFISFVIVFIALLDKLLRLALDEMGL